MEFLSLISILLILLIIAYQDFTSYAVSWVLFPFLAVIFITSGLSQMGYRELLLSSTINFVIIMCQLSILTIYFAFKEKRIVFIINSKIGLGDVLFFVAISLALSPVNFILFLSASLILSFLVTLIWTPKDNTKPKVPLAGYLSVCYIIFMSVQLLTGFDTYGDQFVNLLLDLNY